MSYKGRITLLDSDCQRKVEELRSQLPYLALREFDYQLRNFVVALFEEAKKVVPNRVEFTGMRASNAAEASRIYGERMQKYISPRVLSYLNLT